MANVSTAILFGLPCTAYLAASQPLGEPSSALDPGMAKQIRDAMIELAEEGMTMIVVTLEMGFARTVADRIIFMDSGEIVEEAEPKVFFSNPRSERTRLVLSQILR